MRRFSIIVALAAMLAMLVPVAVFAAPPLPGAIFTTDSTCSGVDLNIYNSKDAVYIDGGPAHPGAASLQDGSYYIQVTEPDGTLLGTSIGSGNETPFVVSNGEPVACYQLSAILIKASDSTLGYDTTTNPGGEYKVWVSSVAAFDNDSSKTDNFKVKESVTPPLPATLHIRKFYDANGNGLLDGNEPYLTSWKVNITDGMVWDAYTPVDTVVEPDKYTVTEYSSIVGTWYPSTDTQQFVTLASGDDKTITFGNYCKYQGVGARTIGYWKTHQAATSALLPVTLGSGPYTYIVDTWTKAYNLLNGANSMDAMVMLKAQLLGALLNVKADQKFASAYIAGQNKTVSAVIAEAQAFVGQNGSQTLTKDSALRTQALSLKTLLDGINNSNENGPLVVINPTACDFSFP